MKKLSYICAILVALISFTGCYSGRVGVYERPPVRRVIVASPYYYPAPVIIHSYGSHGYYGGRGRRGYGRY